jgi:hypothetical protein
MTTYTKINLPIDLVKLLLEGLRIGGLGIDERVSERAQLHVALREAYNAFNPTKHEGICVEVTENHQMILAKAEAAARHERKARNK